MPIRPSPRRYQCTACGWSKTVVPRSDALMPGHDHFDSCPKCGHAPLSSEPVGNLPTGMGRMAETVEKWLRR